MRELVSQPSQKAFLKSIALHPVDLHALNRCFFINLFELKEREKMRGYNLNLHLLLDFEGITNGLQWDINDMYGINPLSLEGILY